MIMEIIESLKVLLAASGHEDWYEFPPAERHVLTIAAQAKIAALVSAYEALAPDWNTAPSQAQYYTINNNGQSVWHVTEPERKRYYWESATCVMHDAIVQLPLGVDWRCCIWRRP